MPVKRLTTSKADVTAISDFISECMDFRNSIKFFHWNVTGKGSYSQHIAIDQAIDTLDDVVDRLAETSVSMYGILKLHSLEYTTPIDIISHCEDMYERVKATYSIFPESFQTSILDDYSECIQQLLFRLERLS